VELLDLGIEIVEGWYNVENTKYDVGTLRFKDFIRVVCISVMVLGNHYIWIL
jgi:hypothetical protein